MKTSRLIVGVLGAIVLAPAGECSGGGLATARRAFEITDYYRTAFVRAPSLSRDGALVAFAVRRYDLEAGDSWTETWLMDADGSRQRRMTSSRDHNHSPALSPDGRNLVFVSDRGGGTEQLWVMPTNGGEGRQLTHLALGVSAPVWAPDGQRIAVTSPVFPECGTDQACMHRTLKTWEGGRLKAHLADTLLYRHWDSWRDGTYNHILLIDPETGAVVRDLTPGRFDAPSPLLAGGAGYAFSPDSAELCFVADRSDQPALSTNSDLWTIALNDEHAEPSCLTAANPAWDGDPAYSPDGRYLAFRRQETPGNEADLFTLALLDRRSGTIRQLTGRQGFDDWVIAHRWDPRSDTIFFQATVQGRTPLLRIGLPGGGISHVHTDGAIGGWSVSGDGLAIIYTRSRISEPPEILRVAATGGQAMPLTAFNEWLRSGVDLRAAEELVVPGEGGRQIQVLLVKPNGFDPARRYPLILNVHGGPELQWTDAYTGDLQILPAKGYVMALPNPSGSIGFGQDNVDAVRCDWGGRAFRDLMAVTDALERLPYVDRDRIGAMGWSYGATMIMWFEGHTQRFKALAAMMGEYNLRSMYGSTDELWFMESELCGTPWTSEHYARWSPSEHVKSFSTPALVITGERDFRVPYTEGLQFFTDLQRMRVPSRLVVFSNASHSPGWHEMVFYYLLHLDWFHRYLGGGPPPWEAERYLRNQVFANPAVK